MEDVGAVAVHGDTDEAGRGATMTVLAPRPVITSDGPMAPTLGWAEPVDRLHVRPLRAPALNLNVEGRQVTGPLQGFGSLWQ